MRLTKHSIQIDGQQYFYWQGNPKQKNAIILLHGFPGNHQALFDFADYFSNCRLIIPDLPACGESADLSKTHTLKSYADWLNKFFIQLGINQATLIGHSFGSRVALYFCNLAPKKVSRLVLITPVTKVDGFIAELGSLEYQIADLLPQSLRQPWLTNGLTKKLTNFVLYKTSKGEQRKKLITLASQEINRVNPQVSIELFADFKKFDLLTIAPKIKTKALVIAGSLDEIAPLKTVKELAGLLPQAKLTVMKGSGHMAPLEESQITANIIQSWLSN